MDQQEMNVFISYAHSPESHTTVKELVEALRARNITVLVDTDTKAQLGPPEGWIQWMRNSIRIADWVLILFDENYLRAWYGQERCNKLYGSTYEARLISHDLYIAHGWNKKFIPLHHDSAEPDPVPADFQCNRYRIPSQSDELAGKLISSSASQVLPPKTDFTRLPRIATRDLINREHIINDLFHALEAPQLSVFGLVADGGVGKTAVVFDWVSNLDAAGYGLTHIFAWPFLDPTKRLATTSEPFFTCAFKHFNRIPEQRSLNLPHAQANCLLHILRSNKSIVVLDGIDSLQDGSDTERRGRILDEELLKLLKTASLTRMGQAGRLIIVTSRVTLADLSNEPGYKEIRLPPLSSEHGAVLLSRVGVQGTEKQLTTASDKYQGHCLSLLLLGKIIAKYYPDCDISNCTLIDPLVGSDYVTDGTKEPLEHARRVMQFYEAISQPNVILFLEMMGLFLEPLDASQKQYFVNNAKFAKPLRCLEPKDWVVLENNLEDYGLLLPESGLTRRRTRWACHRLIREYFRNKLRENDDYWQDANEVLFDFFRNLPTEEQPSSREGLRPLYRAVRHGCLANRFKDALQVYKKRILREPALGFSTNRLGAAAEDVAC